MDLLIKLFYPVIYPCGVISMTTILALCAFPPDPFGWAGGDTMLTSLWHVAAGCAVILGIEALLLIWKSRISWCMWCTLAASTSAAIIAIIAGHLAATDFPLCAGAPGLSDSFHQQVTRDWMILGLMQGLGWLIITLVFILLWVSRRYLINNRSK
jgi:hypothetical protein